MVGVDPGRARAAWDGLAAGLGPMEVSRRTGVSKSQVYRWHHSVGGVYRPAAAAPYSTRYLDREERYEIARLHEQGEGVRAIARAMSRSPSTISRELGRNGDARSGPVPPRAGLSRLAWERQRRPRPTRLASSPALRAVVQDWLDQDYSPQEITGGYPGGVPR